MTHTIQVDDTTAAGKRFFRDFKRVRKGIVFQNPAVTGIIPEGYMTGDEFERRTIEGLRQRLEADGYL